MILGGAEAILSYPTEKYPFQETMQSVLGAAEGLTLREAHTLIRGSDAWAPLTFEGDTSTEFHRRYYNSAAYPQMMELYRGFLRNWLLPRLAAEEGEVEYIVQAEPSFRIHLPNNSALGALPAVPQGQGQGQGQGQIGLHCDADYNHPSSETNYILSITGQAGTNSCYVETEPGKGDFHSVDIAYGELFRFHGNRCRHYNRLNTTGDTRISLDFRVIPGSKWYTIGEAATEAAAAVHSGRPFSTAPGGYYVRIKLAG